MSYVRTVVNTVTIGKTGSERNQSSCGQFPVSMSESDDQISVRANVLGLDGNELKVSVEPQRITILGKKEMSATESEDRKIEYTDRAPDQILAHD
jgi:HSP20 family molecular chaperone IbpA